MTSKPAGDTCIAYLIRHGATDSNLADPPLLQGRSVDGTLSDEGLRQAQRAAAKLADCGITGVFSSPLRRARETAERIASHHDLPVQIVPEITEVDVGAWEGRSWVEIEQNETEGYRRFVENPDEHGYREGENLGQVRDRVVPALDQILSAHLGQRIAIVAHNVVNRVYLATNVRLPLARARGIPQDNCGINVLRYRANKVKVVSINSIFHLDD
jgi:broad specificity phosphatase PhoE